MRCKYCGSRRIFPDTQKGGFSAGKAVAGAALLGTAGVAAGFLGKNIKGYKCRACGAFSEDTLGSAACVQIDNAVTEYSKTGNSKNYDLLRMRYPHIEEVFVSAQNSWTFDEPENFTPSIEPVEETPLICKNTFAPLQYTEGEPIFVRSVGVYQGEKNDILRIDASNISDKTIRSAYFAISVYDDAQDLVTECNFVYQNVQVPSGDPLPADMPIDLMTNMAYRVAVQLQKVSFTDDSVWKPAESAVTHSLQPQVLLTKEIVPQLQTLQYLMQEKSRLKGTEDLYQPVYTANYHRCICGTPVPRGAVCRVCGMDEKKLGELLDPENLIRTRKEKIRQTARERAQKTESLFAAGQEAAYKKAAELQGKNLEVPYREAAALFATISGYRDAEQRAAESLACAEKLRQDAVLYRASQKAAMNTIKAYEEAIKLLQTISGRKNVDELISEYQKKIESIRQRDETLREERILRQEAKERAKRKKRNILVAVAIVLIIGVIALIFINNAIKEERRQEMIVKLQGMQHQKTSSVSAGYQHIIGLKSDGTVVAAGWNYHDQCNVFDWTDIVAVSAGGHYTVGLKSDGTVVAVGNNESDQCDVSGWTDIVAVSAGGWHTLGLKSDGTVVAVGNNESDQCDVSGWTDIVAVSAGGDHTVGLKYDGTVVAAGWNYYDQCNVFDWTDIVAVSTGRDHTVGLKSDGTVVAVGNNEDGQCKVSHWTDIVAVSAGGRHTLGLKSDGTVVAVGNNEDGQCKVSGWTDIVAVSAGGWHTLGLKSDGTVVAVGYNESGQCDVSGWEDIKLPE